MVVNRRPNKRNTRQRRTGLQTGKKVLRQRNDNLQRKTKKDILLGTTAIIKAVRPYELNAEQIELIRRTIAKGTTDDELQLFLWVAKKHRLDPFTRQLHLVKRWDSQLLTAGNKKGGYVATIQVGIDGYRQMASRYDDFGSVDEPEFEFDKETGSLVLARIRVWKKGFDHPTVGVAFWDEYHPDLNKPEAFMWRKMPKHMLAKCAESLALRKAYPDLADIYTDEEMAASTDDFSPSGRELRLTSGTRPSEQGFVSGSRGAAQAVAQQKIEAHRQSMGKVEAARQPGAEQRRAGEYSTGSIPRSGEESVSPRGHASPAHSSAEMPTAPGKGKTVRVYWPSDASEVAHIAGGANGDKPSDIAELVSSIQKFGTWLENAKTWAIAATEVPSLKEICKNLGYEWMEVSGPPTQGAGHGPEKTVGQGTPAPATVTQRSSPTVSVVSGFVQNVKMGMTGKNSPTRQVQIYKTWYTCFSQSLFEFLDKAQGKDGEFLLDGRKNIVGVKRLGKRQFDNDGKTPIIDVNEERSGSLF